MPRRQRRERRPRRQRGDSLLGRILRRESEVELIPPSNSGSAGSRTRSEFLIPGNEPKSVELATGMLERIEIAVESASSAGLSEARYVLAVQRSSQQPEIGSVVAMIRQGDMNQSSFIKAIDKYVAENESDPNYLLLATMASHGSCWPDQNDWDTLESIDNKSDGVFIGLAVHATSRSYSRAQMPPSRVTNIASHILRWSAESTTHQVGFYGLDKKPMGIEVLT